MNGTYCLRRFESNRNREYVPFTKLAKHSFVVPCMSLKPIIFLPDTVCECQDIGPARGGAPDPHTFAGSAGPLGSDFDANHFHIIGRDLLGNWT